MIPKNVIYGLILIFLLLTIGLLIKQFAKGKNENTMKETKNKKSVSKEDALKIAHENASSFYSDFSIYDIEAKLENGIWYIDYNINNPQMVGGGPHYSISAETGEIVSFRFEQ